EQNKIDKRIFIFSPVENLLNVLLRFILPTVETHNPSYCAVRITDSFCCLGHRIESNYTQTKPKGDFMSNIVSKIALGTVTMSFTVSFTFAAFAQVPPEVARLLDRPGTYTSLYNGESYPNEDGGECTISMNPYGGDASIAINAATYFTPVADLDGAEVEYQADRVVYTLNDSGKRPGGSVCGDITPLLSYKKTVEVFENALFIKQKYRCLFGGSEEIVEGCSL